jgi:hypothetical protein
MMSWQHSQDRHGTPYPGVDEAVVAKLEALEVRLVSGDAPSIPSVPAILDPPVLPNSPLSGDRGP